MAKYILPMSLKDKKNMNDLLQKLIETCEASRQTMDTRFAQADVDDIIDTLIDMKIDKNSLTPEEVERIADCWLRKARDKT